MIAHVHSLFLISLLNCFVESLLFRVIRYTALADNIDLDLSRIFQFSFDLFGDISCQQNHICICNLFRYYHYTNFPACLNSKGLVDSLKFICNWSESNAEIQSIFEIGSEQLHLFLIID